MAKKNKRSKRKGGKNKRAEDDPKKQDNGLEIQKPSMAMNRQTDSDFFNRLPQELRDHIYGYLFSSTKFAFGKRSTGRTELPDGTERVHFVAIKPAPKRPRSPPGLPTLSLLAHDMVSKIRHMTIGGKPFLLRSKYHTGGYHIESAFHLLPGLRLDQLTVFTSGSRPIDSHTLRDLIQYGSGWKTLRYLTFDSPYPASVRKTGPQDSVGESALPTSWQSDLEDRDGKASNPSVTIYRTKTFSDDHSHEGIGQTKKFMIVVERGFGVDYQESKVEPHTCIRDRQRTEPITPEEIAEIVMGDHVRWDFPGMTWAQIRDAYPPNRDDEMDELGEDVVGIRSTLEQAADELDWILLYHSQE